MKRYKTIISMMLLLGCTVFLWGCGADKEKIAEAEQWVTYQGILVGESTIDDVKAVFGEPRTELKDIPENKDSQALGYDDLYVSVYKEKVNSIQITDAEAPAFWDDIHIGDSFDKVMAQCPVTPEEVKYVQDNFPDGLGKGEITEIKGYLLLSYVDESYTQLRKSMLALMLPGNRFISITADENNIITQIFISAEVK